MQTSSMISDTSLNTLAALFSHLFSNYTHQKIFSQSLNLTWTDISIKYAQKSTVHRAV